MPAYNVHDGFMAGLIAGWNPNKSEEGFGCILAPFLSVKKPALSGFADFFYTVPLEKQPAKSLVYSTGIQSFHYKTNESLDYRLRYIRIDPGIELHWHPNPHDSMTSSLQAKYIYIQEDVPFFSPSGQFKELGTSSFSVFRLQYNHQRESQYTSSGIRLRTEWIHSSYENKLKLSIATHYAYRFAAHDYVRFRWFAAFFPYGARRYASYFQPYNRASISLIAQGFSDGVYDDLYASRTGQAQWLQSQVNLVQDGGFRTPLGNAYQYGISNVMASSVNSSVDIPLLPAWLPLEVYFDYGIWYTFQNQSWRPKSMYNAGLSLRYQNWLAVHFPVLFSDELGELYKDAHKSIFSRLSFTLDLQYCIQKWK